MGLSPDFSGCITPTLTWLRQPWLEISLALTLEVLLWSAGISGSDSSSSARTVEHGELAPEVVVVWAEFDKLGLSEVVLTDLGPLNGAQLMGAEHLEPSEVVERMIPGMLGPSEVV